MKIRKIFSDIPSFRTVEFNNNFSIVLGVAKTKGEGKSHNLGKTTLIELVDHILFGSRDSDRIKAIKSNFQNPVFTVELSVDSEKRLIVADYSKKKKAAFPTEIKQAYEYFIRFQDDYKDEFRKVSIRGKDLSWKPLLLKLMGFNERPLVEKYEIESTIQDYDKFIEMAASSGMKREGRTEEIERLEGRRAELLRAIGDLNFGNIEDSTSVHLASEIDARILVAKRALFVQRKELSAVTEAIRHTAFVEFSSERIELIYADLSIYFGDQVKRDLSDVQAFFQQVTENRTTALSAMKRRLLERVSSLEEEISSLNEKRAQYLQLIVTRGSIEIYRQLSTQLAETETELSLLKQDVYKESIQTASAERTLLKTQQLTLAAKVAAEIDENDSTFRKIKEHYRQIMAEVMDIDSEIVIEKNSTGNLDFRTISWRDQSLSQELKGEMAKKISCAAFDVALRIVNNNDSGFIIHDGVIDNADRNIKKKFIEAMKKRSNQFDFQYIMTAISDDLPESVAEDDIVIVLSDKSEKELLLGRSF
ncbi:MAG: hypothetical protein A3E00_12095 [Curvibacter sp. RIFCSPHIGHO2_12_FULL_63_18]|jgi:uncharacterized protein YydD (DUF2326 family)|uniref:DUF2326 domain-containing protein n=1 Tax=Rhodoferax sp. TaxID=50421 RepID=UPI0008D2A28D|nr:DUF2326 domain-containing protein [Rhodoferax sp.]OGP00988.1 MAG: hypothetical protein A3E00_12095 [Curvibacter sp. RIFCSPHIGHO2_12_FULL_63_18]HCX80562.1 hypothetical protein [Rhodoferax sp.]